MIRAGELRHTVRIEQRSTLQSADGEPLLEWNLFAQRRAGILRTPGREVFSSLERQTRVPTVFKLRFLDGVLPEMRLLCNNKVYDIKSAIDPDGMRSETLISTEEHTEESPT